MRRSSSRDLISAILSSALRRMLQRAIRAAATHGGHGAARRVVGVRGVGV